MSATNKVQIKELQDTIKLYSLRQKNCIKYSTAARQLTALIRSLKSDLKILKGKKYV